MATSAVNLTSTAAELKIKPETLDYAVIVVQVKTGKDNEGNDVFKDELKAITNEKEIATAREKNTIAFEQTVSYDLAGTPEGFADVIKDPEERVAVFNAGVRASRINPRVKKLLEEVNDESGEAVFQPIAGSYDIRDLINEPAQRKNLTPTEKAIRVLRPLFPNKTDAELMGLIGMFASSNSEGTTSASEEMDAVTQ